MKKKKPQGIRTDYAKDAAKQHLKWLNIREPPIIARKCIKRIASLHHFDNFFCPGEAAFICKSRKGKYKIFINKDLEGGRENWAYGHEYAHIALMHYEDFDVNNLTPRQYYYLDREADIFTREFLMPAYCIHHYIDMHLQYPITKPKIGKLINQFNVSWEAMTYRLHELGIAEKEYTKTLFRMY